jgi:hypothetical protein
MSGSHKVSKNPAPTIQPSGGATSQTVTVNTAITTITYTASNATSIALSSGTASLPLGITDIVSNNTILTISGTPTSSGTFNYMVTATHSGNGSGCTNTTSGSIIVNVDYPPYAASASTWAFGSQIWSDRINATQINCQLVTKTSSSGTTTEYLIFSGKYYYNWHCVVNNQTTLCPSPWRVPDLDDVNALANAASKSTLNTQWGTTGVVDPGNTVLSFTQHMYMWSNASYDNLNGQYIETGAYSVTYRNKVCAMMIRCVK